MICPLIETVGVLVIASLKVAVINTVSESLTILSESVSVKVTGYCQPVDVVFKETVLRITDLTIRKKC